MYGPLNGVRSALVSMAVVAMIVGAIVGQWAVVLFLGLGVAIHGAGWWYMYQKAQTDEA